MGKGWGGGGVHPCMTSKNCPTPGAKKTGGGAPRGAKHPGEKKFWPPGEAIFWDFWAKSPPGLLYKHPTEKNFSPPGGGAGEKIFRPPKAAGKFFWGHPPVSTPPLSQNPCPPMIVVDISKKIWLWKKFHLYMIDFRGIWFEYHSNIVHCKCIKNEFLNRGK